MMYVMIIIIIIIYVTALTTAVYNFASLPPSAVIEKLEMDQSMLQALTAKKERKKEEQI